MQWWPSLVWVRRKLVKLVLHVNIVNPLRLNSSVEWPQETGSLGWVLGSKPHHHSEVGVSSVPASYIYLTTGIRSTNMHSGRTMQEFGSSISRVWFAQNKNSRDKADHLSLVVRFLGSCYAARRVAEFLFLSRSKEVATIISLTYHSFRTTPVTP